MTVQHLIAELMKLDPTLQVYANHYSSGCSYEVSYPHEDIKNEYDDIGALCKLKNGTKVVLISLD